MSEKKIGTMVGEIKAGGRADWRLQTVLDETKKLADQRDALRAALVWLLDDMTDAGEDANPETGEVYDSVENARAVLKATKTAARTSKEDALLAALDGLLTLMHRHRWKPNADEHDPIPAALAAYYEAKKDGR